MTETHPSLARLRQLVEEVEPPCATVLIPCDPAREAFSEEFSLRLQTATRQLRRRLETLGVDAVRRKRFEEALAGAADTSPAGPDVRVRAFLVWEQGAAGFGLGEGAEDAVASGEPSVRVAQSFALRPLLRAARRSRAFLLLAVSARRVALYAGDESGSRLDELPRDGLPASLEDALGHDLGQRQAGLQLHSSRGHGGAPVYHGGGGAPDEQKTDLERFHRVLGAALRERLRDDERPLVLAADRSHQPGLRDEAGGIRILDEGIEGNPDHRPEHELAREAAARVRRWLRRRDAELSDELERARGRGKAAVGLEETLRATAMGRTRLLLVPALAARPGRIDASALRPVAPWGDEDLCDELATLALRQGGDVVPWEPGHPPAEGVEFAAILR